MSELEIISLCYPEQVPENNQEEIVCAIGFFDGVHKGHQKVIQTAQDLAKKQNRKSAVITFTPHPSVVLQGTKKTVSYLTPLPEKKNILADMGIDILYVITFNKALAQLTPSEFIDQFIIKLGIKHLVTGFDFTYGAKGIGNVNTLDKDGNGQFGVTIVDKLTENNEKISSTRIRKLIQLGEMTSVKELLGRPLFIRGHVISGAQRGRKIGYPTANIEVDSKYALPKTGVYAVTVKLDNRVIYGMANLGYNPTFEDDYKIKLEVHLFDFHEDIYGKELILEWQAFTRPEQKFAGIEQLIDQLKQDEQEIRHLFGQFEQ